MLTPKEVEERVFPRAKKGGYDMEDVDSFLDQLTADFSELYKENAVLKRRMKVLADKITEFQETEGAMRATLRTAQKMADQIVEEAKTQRTTMLSEAETEARERREQLEKEITAEESRLEAAKASVARMTASIRELVTHEQEFLNSLPEMDAAEAARVVQTSARPEPEQEAEDGEDEEAGGVAEEIGDSISRMLEEAARGSDDDEDDGDLPKEDDGEDEVLSRSARRFAEEDADDTPTRRIDLSELRFGRNYEIK